jgi:heptosyltransferase-2
MNSVSPRILILRLSSIGDILLTTPFLQQVRNRFKQAHITYVVKKEFSDLLKYNPHINHLIKFDSSFGIAGLLDLARELKENEFDIIFDLHKNLRTNRLTSLYKQDKVSKIVKDKFKRWLLIHLKINLFKKIRTAPQKYLQTGLDYNIEDNNEKLQIFLNDDIEQQVNELLINNNLHKGNYLCLAPGAAHYTKMWPLEYVEKLISKISNASDNKIVLIGGPNEKDILSQYNTNNNIINFCGETSLLQSAGILKYARGIITNDSGLMHMAAAVDIPIVALFGSTTEELGFFPYRANASILQVDDLWCRPCTHIGREKCPLGHFNCMRQISVNQVFNEIEKRIAQ